MKFRLLIGLLISISATLSAQHKTENIIIVTLDGMRWQEVMKGVDTALMNSKQYTRDSEYVAQSFYAPAPEESRKKIFPFIWSAINNHGQIYGNRTYNNFVNITNPYQFSYPGYNEIFTGYPDKAVNSNDKVYNKNENVLEFINKQPGYQNKVAAFSTWGVFPYILNAPRSGIYVNSDVDTLKFKDDHLKLINDWQFLTTRPIGVRPDVITYFAAREYLKAYKPKVLYIAFDETDDFAHGGMYDQYLRSAYSQDRMIEDLWNTIQSMPQYKNKTTLIITCDHGRGDKVKSEWTSHGEKVADSNEIWLVALGPDTKPLGEVKEQGQLYQRQIATTLAALLGFNFKPAHEVMKPIESIYK
ncbi:alkaline phosphatase family protein [Foetidibacter luteolus]|uniref:alkaline phosphatase family protein n=1 Tax=Foetidibacter luteolus TaxID=2608880 RepID=UPI00129AD911|nr:alkaline phosphatase family protein [Foetidibacter luteolus]